MSTQSITTGPRELDFNRVEVFMFNAISGDTAYRHAYDMMEWNHRYTPEDSSYVFMDDPTFNGIKVHPAQFNSSSQIHRVNFSFFPQKPANRDEIVVKVRVEDARGNSAEASFP